MNRTFKKFTVLAGGTPQPLIGTWITATTGPPAADPQGQTLTNLPVNDSSMFNPGDYVRIVTAGLATPERVLIQSVPDGTHIKVLGLVNTRTGGVFGTGDFVALSNLVNSVYVQTTVGNAGTIFVGNQGMVKATDTKVIAELVKVAAGVQAIDFSDQRSFGPDVSNSADFWIDGTTNDGYLPSLGIH